MTVLRRYGLWLIAATVAGILGAWLFSVIRPGQYLSTAQVDVEPNASVATAPNVPNMETEIQVATSGVVLASTARAIGTTPLRLAIDLSATVASTATGTANVLTIGCTRPTAAAAQRCAAVAAASYLAFRNEAGMSKSTRKHDPLQVTLVTPATRPTAPAGPGRRILLPVGAVLGLALGVGAIFVRDHFDDRVRDDADLERCLEAPVLGAIPFVSRGTADPALVFGQAPASRAAEAYRYLRAHLNPLISAMPDRGAVLLVAGPHRREGRTCVAANLAAALAHAGTTVILVDADLRQPSLSEVFGAGERPGLTDLLEGRASPEEVAVPTYVPGLSLVTAGQVAGGPVDLLEVTRLTRALAGMRAAADVLVVDSAPVLAVSDAITLARVSDLVLVVTDVRRTTRTAASAAVREIREAGPQIIIGVLNCLPARWRERARSAVAGRPQPLGPLPSVPATLAEIAPPRGPNG